MRCLERHRAVAVAIGASRGRRLSLGRDWVVRRFCACPEIGKEYSRRMIQTLEAIVDEHGAVRLLEPLHLNRRHRALVTILTDEPSDAHETALLSETSLAEDWNRPEEDTAWAHLQQAK